MSSSVLEFKAVVELPETGLENREHLAGNLTGLLAVTDLLWVKARGCHCKVVGPLFASPHRLTEEAYRDLFAVADGPAERISALGHPAQSSIAEMFALAEIADDPGNASAEETDANLAADNERIVRRLRGEHHGRGAARCGDRREADRPHGRS